MAEDQTPDVTLIPDPDSPEAKIISDEQNGTKPEGTEENEQTPDYKAKFKTSSEEGIRLAKVNKELQASRERRGTRLEKLESENKKLEKALKEEKPEVYDSVKTKSELSKIQKDLVKQKEANALNEYIADNPEAKQHKDVLKKLGRANPGTSYGDLWNDTIKSIVGEKVSKESLPESGKGSEVASPNTNNLDNFNKLSLAERKAQFKKQGM